MESNGDASPESRNSINNDKQDPQKRRNLRSEYRKLIHDLQGQTFEDEDGAVTNESLVYQPAERFKEHLELAERLHAKIAHTREAALDSHLYRLLASNAKYRVQNLQSDLLTFSSEEFAEKLKSHFEVDRSDYPNGLPNQVWTDLGIKSSSFFKSATIYHFFSGSFDPGEVQPRQIQRKPRASQAVADGSQKPTIVENININDKNYEEKTTEEVENVLQTLRTLFRKNNNEPLCYFRFVIDPTSFSRTVENMFHTSFLIKDGEAQMIYDQYDLPVIKPADNKSGSNVIDRSALAMGISVSEWMVLKTAMKLTAPAIKRKANK